MLIEMPLFWIAHTLLEMSTSLLLGIIKVETGEECISIGKYVCCCSASMLIIGRMNM